MDITAHNLYHEWRKGYGMINHHEMTQKHVRHVLNKICKNEGDLEGLLSLMIAADRVTNAAMWLVVHQTYANYVDLSGTELQAENFKENPQGHTGGSLNMIPAYVGYMLANSISGITRAWLMGQGHCVAAIDSVNLILNNMRIEHAERYSWTKEGLTRYVNDFYSYTINADGIQDSPLGSHVNVNTGGSILEGGYLGFADLQYMHMPLPGETLISFLSDGAFEEQRGSDWAARWWRAEDTGVVVPIMIFNGRRIDQRSILAQGAGLSRFIQHLKNYNFNPMVFDGTDPAAFAFMILESEDLLKKQAQNKVSYPISLPYGIAVAKKGAGFYGEGTNAAHNLPLGKNPRTDDLARKHFNEGAKQLFVPTSELLQARDILANHPKTHRPLEKDNIVANRFVEIKEHPILPFHKLEKPQELFHCPMSAIDTTFMAYVKSNPDLRPRVGNPDEILSNHMVNTVNHLKHRVTEVEPTVSEAIDGKVITVLNEEAVACACFGNKAGINIIVTYEAFSCKMLGSVRQELNWTKNLLLHDRKPGWISIPLILTSHTYENGKNELSHQDTTMCEALLSECSGISRVLFPADHNSSISILDLCYKSYGCIFTLIASKDNIPEFFTEDEGKQLVDDGVCCLKWCSDPIKPDMILTAIGSYQLQEVILAAKRLREKGIAVKVNYIVEPGRFREPRDQFEEALRVPDELLEKYYPRNVTKRIFVTHARPTVMSGALRPLDTGKETIFLGFINQGGTLDINGMLFVNRQNWAHIVQAASTILKMELNYLLKDDEIEAISGKKSPQGILF